MSLSSVLSTLEADAQKFAPIVDAFVAAVDIANPALADVLTGAETIVKAAVQGGVTIVNDVEAVVASVKAAVTATKANASSTTTAAPATA